MSNRSIGLMAAIVACATAFDRVSVLAKSTNDRIRPGQFAGITFEAGDKPAESKTAVEKLEEAVGIFISTRDELKAAQAAYEAKGETVGQELKNKIEELQAQVDLWETKTKRPSPTFTHGDTDLTNEQLEAKEAFYNGLRLGAARMKPEQVKLLSVGTDADGGYLAPTQLLNEIIKDTPEYSPIRSVARVRQTANKSVSLPKRTGTPTATWSGEGGAAVETNGTYGMEEIHAHVLTAMSVITVEALEDAAFNMAAELQFDGAEQFGVAEGLAFILGNGVKKPQGILVNADVLARSVASKHATKLTAQGIINAFYQLKTVYANKATWALNRLALREVRLLTDGAGNYIWTPNLTLAKPPEILERPYIECPDMEAPDSSGDFTAADIAMLLGDFSRGYNIIDRTQMTVQRDDTTLAHLGEVRYIMRRRVGGQVVLPEAFIPVEIGA